MASANWEKLVLSHPPRLVQGIGPAWRAALANWTVVVNDVFEAGSESATPMRESLTILVLCFCVMGMIPSELPKGLRNGF